MSSERVSSEYAKGLEGSWGEELALAAKRGDREARNAFYLRYRRRIYGLTRSARRLVELAAENDASLEVEDVTQQAFLIFCDLLGSWEPEQELFVPYLQRLMPSRAAHYVRDVLHHRSRTQVSTSEPEMSEGQQIDSGMENQVEDVVSWDEHTGKLKEQWRWWLTLRYRQGLSSGQIADLCGYSRRTIDRELLAAITSLREDLQDAWENCA